AKGSTSSRSYLSYGVLFSYTLVISTQARPPRQRAKQATKSRPPPIGRALVKSRFSLVSANIPHRHPIMDEAAFLAGQKNPVDGFARRVHLRLCLAQYQRVFQRHV